MGDTNLARCHHRRCEVANLTQCIKGGSSDGKPGWLIKFDYDPITIEALKASIHHTAREWHDDTKTWWVSEDFDDVLDRLFSNWYALAKCQGTLF